ncbi:MAG: GGDEF domain-containing protein [Spirochaetaceae bacterium]|nr:MAG: GGDEF domain-containing protein [Spirochaetaceae bacterium]
MHSFGNTQIGLPIRVVCGSIAAGVNQPDRTVRLKWLPSYSAGGGDTYRFATVAHYIYLFSLVGHVGFLLLFVLLNAPVLAAYNLLSCAVFVLCLTVNQRGYHRLAFIIAAVEVLLHSSLCAFLIGWQTGFHYFIVGIIPFAVILPQTTRIQKTLMVTGLIAGYGAVYFFSQQTVQLYRLPTAIISGLNYLNLAVTAGAFAFLVHYLAKASARAEDQVAEASRTDYLTGALNRRGMTENVEAARSIARRSGRPLTVIIGDLDDFKLVNDNYGHNCGDHVLIAVTDRLNRGLREEDLVARWGGEEFLVLLPATDTAGAQTVANKLLEAVSGQPFGCGSVSFSMTITLGLATGSGHEPLEDLIGRADRAMYHGKQTGKNRLISCDPGRRDPRATE